MFLRSPRCHLVSLNAAFASALSQNDPNMRHTLYERLLREGATGAAVQKALIVSVTNSPEDTALLKLVKSKTSINDDEGQVLCVAIEHSLREHITLLLIQYGADINFEDGHALRISIQKDVHCFIRVILECSCSRTTGW